MKLFTARLALAAFTLQALAPLGADAAPRKKRGPASATPWAVSGYLPEAPTKKVYVKISGDTIDSVSETKPSGTLIETDAVIFPGLMDMHSHIKYNVLPLWDLAKSQFLNRFEWRGKFPDYKDAVSANMKGMKGDAVCAGVRWAEIKAMTGGATAIQGIGGDSKCAKGFGINNIEIPEDFDNKKIRGMTDLVMPDLVGKVFVTMIEPEMNKGKTYEQAYAKMLEDQKVTPWVNFFVKEMHTLGNGLKLLIGDDFGLKPNQSSTTDYGTVKPKIREYLKKAPYNAKDKDIEKQLEAMNIWIFGKGGKDAYLTAKKEEKTAFDFLSKGGVLTVNSSVRRYIGMFESSIRQSGITYLTGRDAKAIIAHVAEGMRDDRYNRMEYQYTKKFGLAREGLVIIHGVGMDAKDLQDAARNKISVVWSPFSNLLLYGETLDVEAAKRAGVNLALGVDWTPTGSKHILDELKIARRYLDHKKIRGISNKDLVEMASINAAKAIRMDNIMGKVAPRYKANLTIVACEKGKDPYDCLVNAGQKDVELMVINGQGLYGELSHVKAIAANEKDREEPQLLPKNRSACGFQKAIRFLPSNDYDRTTADRFRSVDKIEDTLVDALKKSESKKQKVTLDPLFNCEDAKYTKRFEDYIEKELDANNRARDSARRGTYKLNDDWTPFSLDEAEGDDEHQ